MTGTQQDTTDSRSIHEQSGSTCPLFDQADGAGDLICLALAGNPLRVSQTYAETYCLTAHHAYCSLFTQKQTESVTGGGDTQDAVGTPVAIETLGDQVQGDAGAVPAERRELEARGDEPAAAERPAAAAAADTIMLGRTLPEGVMESVPSSAHQAETMPFPVVGVEAPMLEATVTKAPTEQSGDSMDGEVPGPSGPSFSAEPESPDAGRGSSIEPVTAPLTPQEVSGEEAGQALPGPAPAEAVHAQSPTVLAPPTSAGAEAASAASSSADLRIDGTVVTMPADPRVEKAPVPLRVPRQSSLWETIGLLAGGAIIVAVVVTVAALRSQSESRSQTPKVSTPTGHRGSLAGTHSFPTVVPRSPASVSGRPTSVPIAPARSWSFAPAAKPPDQVMMIVSNPGRTAVRLRVRVRHKRGVPRQAVTVPPKSSVEMELPPGIGAGALSVKASGPILVQRILIRKGQVQTSVGVPGGTGSRKEHG